MPAPAQRLLVVDDNPASLAATSRVLRQAGYEVAEARDGATALAMVRAQPPTLVLLDVVLPGESGFDVLEAVRADPALERVSVLLVSASATLANDQARGLDAGADGYLVRPIANAELLARVRAQLRQLELTERLRRSEARLRELLRDQVDAVLVIDAAGLIQFANPAAAVLFGREEASLLGAPFGFPIEGPSTTELEIVRRDGSVALVEMRRGETEWEGASASIATLRDVTERAEMIAHVTELAERLHATLESITDALISVDRTWRFTYVNREAERLLRRSAGELLGNELWAMFPEAVGTELDDHYRRAVAEGAPVSFETYFPPLETWFDVKAFPSSGGLTITFRDITEHRATREALLKSAERLNLVAMATNDTIWDWDLTTDELWWSGGIARFGHRPEDLPPTSASWRMLAHPDDQDRVTRGMQRAFARGDETWTDTYRLQRGDGTYARVLDRGQAIRDDHGRPVRMIGGLSDQTERLEAQARIAEQAALIDHASDAIIVRDLDHRVLFWNRAAEDLYGFSASEAIGGRIDTLIYDDPAPFDEATREVLRAGAWSGELHQRTREGGVVIVHGRWSLTRDEADRPRAILALNTDITERRRVERQLLRAQRMESIGTLAGGIAHDLNNVLAPILMSLDFLKIGETDPDRLETLEAIETSTLRGADMVNQVLSFARGVEGRRQPVDLTRLLKSVARFARDTFLKSIEVRERLAEGLWLVDGDDTQLHQVFINLCVNARDAMTDGGRLTLSARNVELDAQFAVQTLEARAGRYCVVEVEDTGSGMSEATREKIFDPFFTTKDFGKGTGLGLSTALAIVTSHGGFIRTYSEVGRGSRFQVYLPASVDGAEVASDERASIVLPRGDGELLLVVDDEASVRQITRQTLEAFGYRVLLAADGAEAIARFVEREDEIALVLTDMMMPIMDGPATIAALHRIRPDLPIVASSGLGANGRVARASEVGVVCFLPKPYSADALLNAIHDALHATSTR